MTVAVVGEFVVGGRELLEALQGYVGEVAGEVCVLSKDHRASRHKAVDQRLLTHKNANPTTDSERNQRIS